MKRVKQQKEADTAKCPLLTRSGYELLHWTYPDPFQVLCFACLDVVPRGIHETTGIYCFYWRCCGLAARCERAGGPQDLQSCRSNDNATGSGLAFISCANGCSSRAGICGRAECRVRASVRRRQNGKTGWTCC